MRNKKPLFIYVLAILFFILALYVFIQGTLIAGGILLDGDELVHVTVTSDGNSKNVMYNGGILNMVALYVLALFFLILGFGIFHRKNWARRISIILLILLSLATLPRIIFVTYYGIIDFIIFFSIAIYLITSRKVRNTFKRKIRKT